MSIETVETVVIETENGPVIINSSDFDKEIHKLYGVEETIDTFDREAAKEYLASLGVQFAKNVSDKTLAKLVEDTKAALNG